MKLAILISLVLTSGYSQTCSEKFTEKRKVLSHAAKGVGSSLLGVPLLYSLSKVGVAGYLSNVEKGREASTNPTVRKYFKYNDDALSGIGAFLGRKKLGLRVKGPVGQFARARYYHKYIQVMDAAKDYWVNGTNAKSENIEIISNYFLKAYYKSAGNAKKFREKLTSRNFMDKKDQPIFDRAQTTHTAGDVFIEEGKSLGELTNLFAGRLLKLNESYVCDPWVFEKTGEGNQYSPNLSINSKLLLADEKEFQDFMTEYNKGKQARDEQFLQFDSRITREEARAESWVTQLEVNNEARRKRRFKLPKLPKFLRARTQEVADLLYEGSVPSYGATATAGRTTKEQ